MVSIQISKKWLLNELKVSEAELIDALPQIKAEVDANNELLCLSITGDRPDLLGRHGLLRALKGYFEIETGLPELKVEKAKTKLTVDESVKKVRPFAMAAFARGLRLDDESVRELIQIQEKLVLTHGRRRRKVAIGIHDASVVKGDLAYKAVNNDYEFQPLGWKKKASIKRIMREHEKGKEYSFCLNGKDYPLFCDEKGVLSMPPIINAQRTAVTKGTTDLLLDVTGTDWEACNVALNILCREFADAGARIEGIESNGKLTPETEPEKMLVGVNEANRLLGTELSDGKIVRCLEKQRLGAKHSKKIIECAIPRYRADFLHSADLIEEIALGYGYNAFEPKKSSVFTKGGLLQETLQENRVRDAITGAGFLEALTHVLSNEEIAFKSLAEGKLVHLKNPISKEYCCLRGALLPSLLQVLSENTHNSYPQRLFEVGEVIVTGGKQGTETRRHACAVSCHANANITEGASALFHALHALGIKAELKPCEEPGLWKGRQGKIMVNNKKIGTVGEVHPQALENHGIEMPCAAFEFDLDALE